MSREKDPRRGDSTSLAETGADARLSLLMEWWGVRPPQAVRGPNRRLRHMTKTAEFNPRLIEDLPVIRLPKFIPPGGGLSIWWMGDDKITFQAISSDTNGAYAFWVNERLEMSDLRNTCTAARKRGSTSSRDRWRSMPASSTRC